MGFVRRREAHGTWEGITPREYESGAIRQVLVGREDGATQVELRYFTLPIGGVSALEHHPHEHAIMVLHGRAEVRLGETLAQAEVGDVVFVSAGEVHQLRALGDEPLGFLCTALANRSTPSAPPGV
jgi:quercetin dioxygenase-like cupin family protein